MKKLFAVTVLVMVLAALILMLSSVAFAGKKPPPPPPGGGGECICLDIYAPVICSNGVTYPNLCYATCAKATGCVPANTM